jgi:hypothetical protein
MAKGNWHPSRVSNYQKMIRQRDYEKFIKKNKVLKINPINTAEEDWSIKK